MLEVDGGLSMKLAHSRERKGSVKNQQEVWTWQHGAAAQID